MKGEKNMTSNQVNLDYSQREKIVKNIDSELSTNWKEGLELLKSYDDNKSEELKRDILAMVWRFGLKSQDSIVRQTMVNYMLNVFAKQSLFLQGQAIKFLQDFSYTDFNNYAVNNISSLTWEGDYNYEIILLVGIANIRTKIPELKKMAGNNWKVSGPNQLYSSCQWAASLVLARFGDIKITKRIIEQVNEEQDIIVRSTRLFADLAYTRQQLAFDTLRKYLHSQERLPQVKSTVPGQKEAIYAAEIFANFVVGCPVSGPDIEIEEVQKIKIWADRQSKWLFRD
ncbi:MAG: hypothetical protein U9R19_05455 [Bacteroidota bacterium]|nr:hypothetical protein [Bacteroidota bacterium]